MNRRRFLAASAGAAAGLALGVRPAAGGHGVNLPYGGVALHLKNNVQYADTTRVGQALRALGTKIARDEWCPPTSDFSGFQSRFDSIQAANPDMKWVFVSSRADQLDSLPMILDQMEPYAARFAAVEGPNEWNLSGRSTWKEELSLYTKELYCQVKARPAFAGIPVVGPSIAYSKDSGPFFGDHSAYMDVGNVHLYQPSYQVDTRYIGASIDGAKAVSGTKPMIATELNGQIGDGIVSPSGYVPTEADQAWCYRELSKFAGTQGVHRVFVYQLCNRSKLGSPTTVKENQFGCVREDWSTKPLFHDVLAANRRG